MRELGPADRSRVGHRTDDVRMSAPERRELAGRLRDAFEWTTDRSVGSGYADLTGWWRDPSLLRELGPALAGLFDEVPTVVVAPESRGLILGALTAQAVGAGLVEARKDRDPATDSDPWLQRTTPPDYRDRHVSFGFRRALVRAGDRVLMVDDWAATGSTARTVQQLVSDAGATWLGAAVLVDALEQSRLRRTLELRSLLRVRDLPDVRTR